MEKTVQCGRREIQCGRREIQNTVAGEKRYEKQNMNIFRIKKQSIKHNEKYCGPEHLPEISQTSENMGETDTQTEL